MRFVLIFELAAIGLDLSGSLRVLVRVCDVCCDRMETASGNQQSDQDGYCTTGFSVANVFDLRAGARGVCEAQ